MCNLAIEDKIADTIDKQAKAKRGEKSIEPNLNQWILLNLFKNGSHIFAKKLVTRLYRSEGIQVKKILTKQTVEYKEIIVAKRPKSV